MSNIHFYHILARKSIAKANDDNMAEKCSFVENVTHFKQRVKHAENGKHSLLSVENATIASLSLKFCVESFQKQKPCKLSKFETFKLWRNSEAQFHSLALIFSCFTDFLTLKTL